MGGRGTSLGEWEHNNYSDIIISTRIPVAQWVKRWPTDLADRVRSSLEVFLSLSSKHRPDMAEILLKRT